MSLTCCPEHWKKYVSSNSALPGSLVTVLSCNHEFTLVRIPFAGIDRTRAYNLIIPLSSSQTQENMEQRLKPETPTRANMLCLQPNTAQKMVVSIP